MKITVQGGCQGCVVLPKVFNTVDQSHYWAMPGVARSSQADELPTDPILLRREFESNIIDSFEFLGGCCEGMKATVVYKQVNVGEPEGGGFRIRRVGVFARAQ